MFFGKKFGAKLVCLLLTLTMLAVAAPMAMATVAFDDLLEAKKTPTEFTVTVDKTTVKPGDVVTATVAITGGERSITHYVYYPVWSNAAYEITGGEVIGLGLEADTGAVFQLHSGAVAVFSKAAVRTGELFRYTIQVKEDAAFGAYALTNSVETKRSGQDWNCTLIDATITVVDPNVHEHSFTKYVSNDDATCTEDGTETARCDGCEETHTRTVENSSLGHDYVKTVTPPTCTDIGYVVFSCSRCPEGYVGPETPSLGHSFTNYISNDDATWEKDGTKTAVCDREGCNETDTIVDEGSKLPHGWVQHGDEWFYYNKGFMVTGWFAYGPEWYYFGDGGKMYTGFLTYGGQQYFFDRSSGRMTANKWVSDSGKWYYFNKEGHMHTGWLELGGAKYYMKPDGAMVTGTVTIDGKKHKFDGNGIWQGELTKNGWVQENGKWYYYQEGVTATRWLEIAGKWYYFKPTGEMTTGWLAYGPYWYYFHADGSMYTGFFSYGGQQYFFDRTSGRMTTNKWVSDNGKWYYFDGNGYMVTGWLELGEYLYLLDPTTGAMWHDMWANAGNGRFYYFSSNGYIYKNGTYVIDGESCTFDEKGYCTNPPAWVH